MGGPAWLSGTFAAVMLVISAYCALRLAAAGVRRRESELDADGLHLVMGVAMAGMLAPGLSVAPTSAWTAVFGVAAGWFGWQQVRVWRGLGTGPWRCPYPVPHLAESLAMVYMLAAVRAATGAGPEAGMAGMASASSASSASTAARLPEIAVLFALFMVGYVAWLGDRFSAVGAPAASPASAAAASTTSAAAASTASPAIVAAATSASMAAEGSAGTATETAPATTTATVGTSMSATAQAGGCWPVLAPRGACCYKIAMAIVMGYMLIVVL